MDDYAERIRVLYRILTDLQIMADEYNLTVSGYGHDVRIQGNCFLST